MPTLTRRKFVQQTLGATASLVLAGGMPQSYRASEARSAGIPLTPKPTDIKILEVTTDLEKSVCRSPMKFGGNVLKDMSFLNVQIRVKNREGKEAVGSGSMTIGNVWAWPPKVVPPDQSLEAMIQLSKLLADTTQAFDQALHPLEIMAQLEGEYFHQAIRLPQLAEPMPRLAVLVVASPFDAALFDAFGKVNGINSYNGLSGEYMNSALDRYLDDQFKGEYLDQYTSREPKPRMPLYHLVGALDPLILTENSSPLQDGLPNSLEEWIERDGLTHLKIKLNGGDLDWDVNRVLSLEKVTAAVQAKRGVTEWVYSLDFNERAGSVEYLLDFLHRVEEGSPGAYQRIVYIEQPTARDLRSQPENKIHKATALKPVVIDETLVDYESLLLAREWGYSGVALKACKGISHSMLMAAAAQKSGMFLCVQDLTCPGESFLISAGLAARIPTVSAIEGNARQYVPRANQSWEERYPNIFKVSQGTVETGVLCKPGLGY